MFVDRTMWCRMRKEYYEASIQGQSREWGGDLSRVLMQWLEKRHENPADVASLV